MAKKPSNQVNYNLDIPPKRLRETEETKQTRAQVLNDYDSQVLSSQNWHQNNGLTLSKDGSRKLANKLQRDFQASKWQQSAAAEVLMKNMDMNIQSQQFEHGYNNNQTTIGSTSKNNSGNNILSPTPSDIDIYSESEEYEPANTTNYTYSNWNKKSEVQNIPTLAKKRTTNTAAAQVAEVAAAAAAAIAATTDAKNKPLNQENMDMKNDSATIRYDLNAIKSDGKNLKPMHIRLADGLNMRVSNHPYSAKIQTTFPAMIFEKEYQQNGATKTFNFALKLALMPTIIDAFNKINEHNAHMFK